MTHFIYGYPGSGKSTFVAEKIAEDVASGNRCFLLVPEQETVEVERRITGMLPPSAQLSFEVLNFSRLANKAFRLYGGLSYHYITPGLKMLLMWQTLDAIAGNLKEYTASRRDNSLPSLMLSAVAELRAWGVSTGKLDEVAQNLAVDHPLKNKLYDLSLVTNLYESTLRASFDDVYDDLDKLCELLKVHPFLEGSHIYVDGFTDYTKQEYDVLKYLIKQADEIYFTIPAPSENNTGEISLMGIFEAEKQIREMSGTVDPIEMKKIYRTSSPSLLCLIKNLWNNEYVPEDSSQIADDDSVTLYACETPYEEADAAAMTVLSLVEKKYKFGEIAVIARNADAWRGILDCAFEKSDIPYFLSEKTDITEKPLSAAVFSALAVYRRDFRPGDVIAYLKTGIPGATPEDVDLFESYLSTWNIQGKKAYKTPWSMNPDGFSNRLDPRGELIQNAANRVRQMLLDQFDAFFGALDDAETARDYCTAVYAFLKRLDVGKTLSEHAAMAQKEGNKKEAAETAATLRSFVRVLSDISAILGDDPMDADEFLCALKTVLDNTDIGTIPTAADEVLVGSASMLRAGNIKCAIIIGANEGEFPAKIIEEGLFSDADRSTLLDNGVRLSGNTARKVADELFYFYRAVTLPSDKLILSYHKSETDGNACTPSLGFTRVKSCLPHLPIKTFGTLPAKDKLFSRAYAFEVLPHLTDRAVAAEVRAALAKDPIYAEKLERLSLRVREPECVIDKATLDLLYKRTLPLSQSKIESFVSCHFSYYCKYVLGLREEKTAEFRYNDLGTLVHRILEIFMRETKNGKPDLKLDAERIERIVRDEMDAYRREVMPTEKQNDPQINHLFDRIYRLILLIIRNLCHDRSKSLFKPSLFEATIGLDETSEIRSPLIPLGDGRAVAVCGTVDRVDHYIHDDTLYLKVTDYKTGSKTFSLENAKRGFDLQMLLYMFALCRAGKELSSKIGVDPMPDKIKPAGIFYLSTKASAVNAAPQKTTEDVLDEAEKGFKRDGLVLKDEKILRALNSDLEEDFILAKIQKDGTFGKGNVLDEKEFAALEEEMKNTVRNIALEMVGGNAHAEPVCRDRSLPCQYCCFKRVCRGDFVKGGTQTESED